MYLISGDGAFGFNAMELETARRVGAPVICVVAVDGGWGMERTAHRFMGVPDHEAHGTDLSPEVRYDELARALGCHGEHVTTLDELAPAIERARSSGLPGAPRRGRSRHQRQPDRLRAVPLRPHLLTWTSRPPRCS